MAAGSITLGGTLLPAPVSYRRTPQSQGAAHELASGGETWDHLAFKHSWEVTWSLLGAAERGTVRSCWQTVGSAVWNDWDGTVGTVYPARFPLQETPRFLPGTVLYDLSLQLQEV